MNDGVVCGLAEDFFVNAIMGKERQFVDANVIAQQYLESLKSVLQFERRMTLASLE